MSYKWPGIPNGDYSFDHGRAVWNRIINFLRRLCEKLDGDLVDASADRRGLMTAGDKDKLDGVEPGAEVNQNAFSGVKVGSGTIEAGSKTDVVELVAGNAITLTADAAAKRLTVAVTDNTFEMKGNAITGLSVSGTTVTYTKGDGTTGTITTQDTTYSDASQSVHGLMSVDDKIKLDGITAGAEPNQHAFASVLVGNTHVAADVESDTLTLVAGSNITLTADATNNKITISSTDTVYTHPTTSGNKHIPSGGASKQLLFWSADGTAAWGDDTWINRSGTPLTTLSGIDNRSPDDTFGIWDGNDGGTGRLFLYSSANFHSGATLELFGANYAGTSFTAGAFYLTTGGTSNNHQLVGSPSGNLFWDSNKIITVADTATTSTAGAMSASDKVKLDGIATGAEVNQNAFSNVKIGNSTIAADSTTDTLTIAAGDYISLTADATNDKVTIGLSMPVVNGTLTATSNVSSNYSSVFRCGRVGYLMIGCGVVAAAKTAWTNTTLYTSSIKPAKNVYQVVHNQDNTSSGCIEITTSGDVILHTYGKALTDGFIRCSVVFAV